MTRCPTNIVLFATPRKGEAARSFHAPKSANSHGNSTMTQIGGSSNHVPACKPKSSNSSGNTAKTNRRVALDRAVLRSRAHAKTRQCLGKNRKYLGATVCHYEKKVLAKRTHLSANMNIVKRYCHAMTPYIMTSITTAFRQDFRCSKRRFLTQWANLRTIHSRVTRAHVRGRMRL